MTRPSGEKGANKKRKGQRQDARSLALETLIEIIEEGAYANIAVKHRLQKTSLKGPDRGLFTELVYGVTRTRNTLDWVLSQFLKRDINSLTAAVRNNLRLGAYQILYLDRIPARAVVHQSVELAKVYGHQGVASFVNGVLRSLVRKREELIFPALEQEPINHIVLKYSHPEWLVKRWVKEYGVEATIALCSYNNTPLPLTLRVNTLKITREELVAKLKKRGILVQESKYAPEGLLVDNWPGLEEVKEFEEGLFLMQDEGSMLVAHVLKPEAGALVIDACAAPGTKTTHLAQLMGNEGRILAFDVHKHKLNLIQDSCRRLGINVVNCHLGDARELPRYVQEQPKFILVDAPCSGLGVLGRRADARWRKTSEQMETLPELQLELLTGAAKVLLPGGVLVYSTCSIAPEENQGVITRFLEAHPDFKLEDLTSFLPFSLERKEDREQVQAGMLQLLPHVHGIDGFFVARMGKKEL